VANVAVLLLMLLRLLPLLLLLFLLLFVEGEGIIFLIIMSVPALGQPE
jgi:hypothetical protein